MGNPSAVPSPAALAALEVLAARGACLTMPTPGRLALAPADGASPDELAALRDARPWLLTAWQAAAAWDAENPPRPDSDPLSPAPGADGDDAADADTWAAALALAAPIDGAAPAGLVARLRFARASGARLRWTDDGTLTLRMPAGHAEGPAVGAALAGHGPALRYFLAMVAAETAAARPPPGSSSNAASLQRAA